MRVATEQQDVFACIRMHHHASKRFRQRFGSHLDDETCRKILARIETKNLAVHLQTKRDGREIWYIWHPPYDPMIVVKERNAIVTVMQPDGCAWDTSWAEDTVRFTVAKAAWKRVVRAIGEVEDEEPEAVLPGAAQA